MGAPDPVYQWMVGGSDIEGETSSTLHFPALIPALNGRYFCRVSNAHGTVVSVGVDVVTPPSAPVVVRQLDDAKVVLGEPLELVFEGACCESESVCVCV